MAVIARSSSTQSTPGLYITVGVIVCLCLASPVLWFIQNRRETKIKRWKDEMARIPTLEDRVRNGENNLETTQRQLAAEASRVIELERGANQLRVQKQNADTRLDAAEERSAALNTEIERIRTESRQRDNTIVDLQGEVVSLEDTVRSKDKRLEDLQRKYDFVNQQFLKSQANTPQSSPLSGVR